MLSAARLLIRTTSTILILTLFDSQSLAECGCRDVCSCLKHSQQNGWLIDETTNFRFLHRNLAPSVPELARLCESSRLELRKRWLGDDQKSAWTPKCDVVLYSTAHDFERFTRHPSDAWGYADLDIGNGRVRMRRLEMRADDAARLSAVLRHELTHVVLADRFTQQRIPRWADEGIAVLSEPADRQQELHSWLQSETARRPVWSVSQLVRLTDYPTERYFAELFYAQSASLIEFLVRERGLPERDVLAFVETTRGNGLTAAIRQHWPDATPEQLDAQWRKWLARSDERAAAN